MKGKISKLFFYLSLFVLLSYYVYSSCLFDNEKRNNKQINTWGYDLLIGNKELYPEESLKIAILDSGINKEHEDLRNVKFHEYNVLEKGELIEDKLGHGTAVAGIIAAEDNDVGVKGILKNVEIYDVKILDDEGRGDVYNLIEAINWCIENEIEIINLSFGFRSENKQLKETINSALQKGIIIVASIGNTYGMRGDYPAIYEGVYSVASINKDLQRSNFSAKRNIDFVMPGENIISTDQEGKYSTFSGTSFSTAYATSLISLLYLQYNNETAQIKKNLSFDDYLKRHVFYGEEWTFDEYGYGLLNLRGEELQ